MPQNNPIFDPLNPGWFLQWAIDRATEENPGMGAIVRNEDGEDLFKVEGEGSTGYVILRTDKNRLHCEITEA